jgi:Na+-transporting NADH:ubiquinone oxidoreductase subunit NqrD
LFFTFWLDPFGATPTATAAAIALGAAITISISVELITDTAALFAALVAYFWVPSSLESIMMMFI